MSYAENYKEIVWTHRYTPPQPKVRVEANGPTFIPDIAEFVAPGKVLIGSRSRLREYEQATGTRQCGELNKVSDYAPPPLKIDQRRIDEAAGKAIQRVLG